MNPTATAVVYPTEDDVCASLRMLRDELREDLDCDPTDARRPLSVADAAVALERAAHRSGPHRIEIAPCPHAVPGNPNCDACIAASAPHEEH